MSKKKQTEETEPVISEQPEPQQVEKTAEVETPAPQQPREEATAERQPEPETETPGAEAEPSAPKFIVKSDSETVEGEYSEAEAHDIRRKREIVRPFDNWRVEPAK